MEVPTIPELLAPYRPSAIAEAIGVTADTVRMWNRRESTPSADKVAPLARFLRVDVSIVLDAIVAQRKAA